MKRTKTLKTKVEDVNEAKGIVTIQITQFDKYDSDNDRLLSGALTKTWQEGNQVHLVDHKMGTSTFVGLPVRKDPVNGIVESQLNLKKQVAKDLLEDYIFSQKYNRSLQHSHGFYGIKDKMAENEKGGYDFAEVRQFEYSTVIFGAVSDTPMLGVKDNGDIIDIINDLEVKLSICNYSDSYGKMVEDKIKELKTLLYEPPTHSEQEQMKAAESTFDIMNAINKVTFKF